MSAAAVLTAVTALLAADPPRPEVNPLAPSLPVLTKQEEAQVERVIERVIQYDLGKLPKSEGPKALADLRGLGPEAVPVLIEGLNRAATIQSSCPAVILARRLAMLLNATEDVDLLDFARENIGAGVDGGRHMGVIRDLKMTCNLRKAALQRVALAGRAAGGEKQPQYMTVRELVVLAGSERGERQKAVLTELGQRQGEQVIAALGAAAAGYDENAKLSQSLLVRNLGRQSELLLKAKLKSGQSQVRAAAAKAVAGKMLPWSAELIALLDDDEADVREAARQSLVRLSSGQDFGPSREASSSERAEAVRRWREWADRRGK